jgi:tetratricopeptide (TPR) repeat protein
MKTPFPQKKFILYVMLFSFCLVLNAAADKKETQHTSGDQSPAVYIGKGDASITYEGLSKAQRELLFKELNNNQKVINRLLKELDEKDIAIEDSQAEIDQWIKKYKELEQRLEQREGQNELVAQAKAKLDDGDLEGAESLLIQSLERHLKQIEKEKKSAASDAFDLAGVKSLQLDYQRALRYYNKAVELDPKNSLYLNDLGYTLYTLGEYKKAIEYYEKAESIFKGPKVA